MTIDTHDPNDWPSLWRYADRELVAAAMNARALDEARDRQEAKRHIGRLLLKAKAHAGNLTLVRAAWYGHGPTALELAELDAEALLTTLDALHNELAALDAA